MIEEYGRNRIGPEALPAAIGDRHAPTEGSTREVLPVSDEALMVAYGDGDVAAFQALYARHRGGLYRFLLRQCGAAALAEELFQDVWLNVIRARRRYVPQARFATYLYRIAHHRLIDHYRRSVHRSELLTELEDESAVAALPADAQLQPEIRAEHRAAVQRLMDLLARLPQPQREAFVMHQEGGLSVDEIAAATGVNAETAKSRLRYALAKLRSGLRELV